MKQCVTPLVLLNYSMVKIMSSLGRKENQAKTLSDIGPVKRIRKETLIQNDIPTIV